MDGLVAAPIHPRGKLHYHSRVAQHFASDSIGPVRQRDTFRLSPILGHYRQHLQWAQPFIT
jgi:hypothetical protein